MQALQRCWPQAPPYLYPFSCLALSLPLVLFYLIHVSMHVPCLTQVHKCPLPGPLYTSKDEMESVEVKPGTRERAHGEASRTLTTSIIVLQAWLYIAHME